jgi:hypothetical protein
MLNDFSRKDPKLQTKKEARLRASFDGSTLLTTDNLDAGAESAENSFLRVRS